MSSIYRRPGFADAMAKQLYPSVPDEGLRSGLFILGFAGQGNRRTGLKLRATARFFFHPGTV
jgi:hypothetical protein